MKTILIITSLLIVNLAYGQDSAKDYSSEVSSMDNILENLYGVISGDAGVKRDWDLFNHLFLPGAKLMPTQITKDGKAIVSYLSPQDYVDRSGPWLESNGFHEKEVHRTVEQFGNIYHVFSTYEAYKAATDTEPFLRGINSIQVLHDNERWWIANIYWQAESEDLQLTAEQLGEK
jgi:hypothetical protein